MATKKGLDAGKVTNSVQIGLSEEDTKKTELDGAPAPIVNVTVESPDQARMVRSAAVAKEEFITVDGRPFIRRNFVGGGHSLVALHKDHPKFAKSTTGKDGKPIPKPEPKIVVLGEDD